MNGSTRVIPKLKLETLACGEVPPKIPLTVVRLYLNTVSHMTPAKAEVHRVTSSICKTNPASDGHTRQRFRTGDEFTPVLQHNWAWNKNPSACQACKKKKYGLERGGDRCR